MRVLLINPHYPISETPAPPLGLAFLAGFLLKSKIEVHILDFAVIPWNNETLEKEIKAFKPDIVGSTAVTMNFDAAVRILRTSKQIDPDIVTVCGGPHASFEATEALTHHHHLDVIVIGEGEQTLLDLVRCVEKKKSFEPVAGIAYREGNRVHRTIARPPVDINSLPLPARHLLPLGRYKALGLPLTLTTSRGCPYKCSFCIGRKMGGPAVRYREPKRVVDELEQIASLGFNQVNIADDLFTANHRHCRDICDEILRRGLSIKWTAFARVDTVSEEVLLKMKAAGCKAVSFGVESANPGILKTIRKGISPRQVVEAVNLCLDTEITPYASFILGLPGETSETLQQTVQFARDLQSMGVAYGYHLLAPFPGTEIRETLEDYHMRLLTDDWSQYHANRAIVDTPGADKEMLDDIVINWEREFHAYLDDIGKKRELGTATEEETGQIEGLERVTVVYDLMMSGAIERRGRWTEKGERTNPDHFTELIKRLKHEVVHSEKELSKALQYCVEKGYLRLGRQEKRIEWRWVDYI